MKAVLGESPYFFSPQGRKYDFPNHTLFGTLYVCGKLPTYPSLKPKFYPKWEVIVNRDLKIRPGRRRQRGRQKSNRFNNQNNFARASRFFVNFFAVTARLRRENA